jgi:hypothetical protein
MLTSIEARRKTYEPAQRGYHAVYRENAVNHCPGCGRTHWHIGRIMAECAFCATALPLSESYRIGAMSSFARARPPIVSANAA